LPFTALGTRNVSVREILFVWVVRLVLAYTGNSWRASYDRFKKSNLPLTYFKKLNARKALMLKVLLLVSYYGYNRAGEIKYLVDVIKQCSYGVFALALPLDQVTVWKIGYNNIGIPDRNLAANQGDIVLKARTAQGRVRNRFQEMLYTGQGFQMRFFPILLNILRELLFSLQQASWG